MRAVLILALAGLLAAAAPAAAVERYVPVKTVVPFLKRLAR